MGLRMWGTLLPQSWPQRTLQPRDSDEGKQTLPYPCRMPQGKMEPWGGGGWGQRAPGKLKEKGGEAIKVGSKARGPLGEG